MTPSQKTQLGLAFTFGVIFLTIILAIAAVIPTPTSFQYQISRITLALAAGGIAAVIPGILNVTIGTFLSASGALTAFVLVYFYSPAQLTVQDVRPDPPIRSQPLATPTPAPIDLSDPQNYRFSDAEIAAYESEVTLATQLIDDGEKLLAHPEGQYYIRVKAWEDNCMHFFKDFDEHHEQATAFSSFFPYWRTQWRASNTAELPGEISKILTDNLSRMKDVRAHAIKTAAEVKARHK